MSQTMTDAEFQDALTRFLARPGPRPCGYCDNDAMPGGWGCCLPCALTDDLSLYSQDDAEYVVAEGRKAGLIPPLEPPRRRRHRP